MVNKVCAQVAFQKTFKKMLELSREADVDDNIKLEFLTHKQLQSKYRALKGKFNTEKLSNLNMAKKNSRLTERATLNRWFMDLVSSNNIPRLSTLLKVCLNSGMGVQSIIGRIGDAITRQIQC